MDGFNREEFFNLFANPDNKRTPVQLGERQQFLLLNEAFEDETMLLDNTIKWNPNDRIEATYVASYTKRDLLVSRDASALTGSAAIYPVFLGFGLVSRQDLPRMASLPSNLRDTTGWSR